MKLFKDIRSYLYNNDYFIDFTNKGTYIYNYKTIDTLTTREITLIFNDFKIKITGTNLTVTKVLVNEMMINGQVERIEIVR